MIPSTRESVSVVLAGEAGQGINSIESALTRLLFRAGYHVFATKEYMSRVRGGVNSVEIRVSSRPVQAFQGTIDILLVLGSGALEHLAPRITPDTLVLGEESLLGGRGGTVVPLGELARQAGGALYANTVAAGLLSALFGVDPGLGEEVMARVFAGKEAEVVERNRQAFRKGHEAGKELQAAVPFRVDTDPSTEGRVLMGGNEAVALGALAGGVQYVVAYPMSPGTTVIELLAGHGKEFDVLVEQVEDEVGVVNMALGAWFAGARTLVTTSGGGFALMTEGVSLSGIAEIPLVVHIAQRPGPATGLPTRTLQGDLFLAAFAGHGEFPRLVLAPGTPEEAFRLSAAAFELADRFQVPVMLLTDQYLLESWGDVKAFTREDAAEPAASVGQRAISYSRNAEARALASPGGTGVSGRGATAATPLAPAGFPAEKDPLTGSWTVVSDPDYLRFRLTADGISPRAIPGHGTGVTVVDSDEHDESGHITEDLVLRDHMVAKRAAKDALLRASVPLPERTGPAGAPIAVLGWGSTRGAIDEALDLVARRRPDLPVPARIHFTFVNPLPDGLAEFLGSHRNLVLVENNESGHLGKLIRMETGVDCGRPVLRHDGMPFAVPDLARVLESRLEALTVPEGAHL